MTTSSSASNLFEYAGIPFDSLPPGAQDVLRLRNSLATSGDTAGQDLATPGTVLEILSFTSQISRLARDVVWTDVQQSRDRDRLEDDSEDLAQEYIRFMLLHAMEYLKLSDTKVSYLSSPALINQLWTTHILETRSYASMCQHLVPGGCTIHHSQKRLPVGEELAHRIAITVGEYCKAFGCLPDAAWWPRTGACMQAQVRPNINHKAIQKKQESGRHNSPQHQLASPQELDEGYWVDSMWNEDKSAASHASFSQSLKIFVKSFEGQIWMFLVDPDSKIDHFEDLISEKLGVPRDKYRLIFAGHQLEVDRSVRSYNIQAESTVHMVLRLRGC